MDQRNLCVYFVNLASLPPPGELSPEGLQRLLAPGAFELEVVLFSVASLEGATSLQRPLEAAGICCVALSVADQGEALRQIILSAFERGFEWLTVAFVAEAPVHSDEVVAAFDELHEGTQVIVSPSRNGMCRFLALDGVYLETVREIPWGGDLEVSTMEARAFTFDLHLVSHGLQA